jgi:hypothetical protein
MCRQWGVVARLLRIVLLLAVITQHPDRKLVGMIVAVSELTRKNANVLLLILH